MSTVVQATEQALDLGGIQGLVARGYGNLPAACFLLLLFHDPAAARAWLAAFVDTVTPGSERPARTSRHIAFTREGLLHLGMTAADLDTFSPEFQEGMTTEHRRRILGDHDESDPRGWTWGAPPDAPLHSPLHALLLLYAVDDDALDTMRDEVVAGFGAHGVELVKELDTHLCRDFREHFGFRDGIAQPIVAGLSRTGPPENTVAAGEFVLGYRNQYDRYPGSPVVSAATDRAGHLPPVRGHHGDGPGEAADTDARDFGHNGTYLVFRQLEQDVEGFWQFVDRMSRGGTGERALSDCVALASKMVGRWPNGAPLALAPDAEDPGLADEDGFGYHAQDPHGLRCPVGAHIRRANPRDSLHPEPDSSVVVSNRHRLLRRGRTYGRPVAESMEAADILAAGSYAGERGLHFICLNTDIARQFEFVQHTWINNPKFEGMYNDVDAVTGDHQKKNAGYFTVPALPVRRRVHDVPRFVQVRGGAYFFMPGMGALRYVAELTP